MDGLVTGAETEYGCHGSNTCKLPILYLEVQAWVIHITPSYINMFDGKGPE